MKIRTQLKIPTYPISISYRDQILSIGSCFSTHIAEKLHSLKYNIIENPSGITFNPASILTTIKRIINPNSLLRAEYDCHNGLYSHPDFHGSFNSTDLVVAQSQALASLQSAHNTLPHTSIVFLTIGTGHVFRSVKTGQIVNNCHKLPAANFTKEVLSVNQIKDLLQDSLNLLQNHNEHGMHFILTVSPIRHIKNGLIEDKLNKSRCLLAVHELINSRLDAHYFPSYELMIDDLRDYRYYKEDLIHPTEMAIDYIYNHFESSLLNQEETTLRQKILNIKNRQNHKSLFPESESHQTFMKKLKADIEALEKEYPHLKFTDFRV